MTLAHYSNRRDLMPQVELTSQLAQLANCPAVQSAVGGSLSETLQSLFAEHAELRQHLLDESGAVRAHLAVFVDGQMINDRANLDIPVGDEAQIFVMQALSGG